MLGIAGKLGFPVKRGTIKLNKATLQQQKQAFF